MRQDVYWFNYSITLEQGRTLHFPIVLDPETLTMASTSIRPLPPWTQLDHHQCPVCPLSPRSHRYCPVAVNLVDVVEGFKDILSYDNCRVVCETRDRTYSKTTSAMEGLSSVFGVVMATSNCPVMDFLKPMARFHLPFSSIEETTVRSTSLFLLERYFRTAPGSETCFDFNQLEGRYARVQQVNEGLLARIRSWVTRDADTNALITLHALCQFLSVEMAFSLASIKPLFERPGSNALPGSGRMGQASAPEP